jgi:signal recognition particle subunit SRP68
MKSAHTGDTKGVTGSTRSHIISRLHKACTVIEGLLESLADRATTGATDADVLEARAYAASLDGAEQFERQNWETCVISYSTAWVLYTALATYTKSDIFKDLLSSTVEPSIRYGSYQIRVPRTVAIPVVARKYFPKADTGLVSAIENLDSGVLRIPSKVKTELADSEGASRTITWRSRTVELEHASIAVALSSVAAAVKNLTEMLSSTPLDHPKERAAAYDGVLIASQDAVDATKHAIDELVGEGISQGDKRIQSLQITRTAISFDMISWRIGRNRVLTGMTDGALPSSSLKSSSPRNKRVKNDSAVKEESTGKKLSRLREKVVLYDSTLQSLDSIKELPGVAADTAFLEELEAAYHYFRALKYASAFHIQP